MTTLQSSNHKTGFDDNVCSEINSINIYSIYIESEIHNVLSNK